MVYSSELLLSSKCGVHVEYCPEQNNCAWHCMQYSSCKEVYMQGDLHDSYIAKSFTCVNPLRTEK